MNKELLYDFSKLLKKYDSEDISELLSLLRDQEKQDELIKALEGLEEIAKRFKKDSKKGRSQKQSTASSDFQHLSNAILNKPSINNAE